ncbi:hypothetical protein VARIO8X_110084 [Burkholderiales bacterium 8X]|nr:hypothetical protein VARIO8X_110084 [Burkholderiales bacterium 8X]
MNIFIVHSIPPSLHLVNASHAFIKWWVKTGRMEWS